MPLLRVQGLLSCTLGLGAEGHGCGGQRSKPSDGGRDLLGFYGVFIVFCYCGVFIYDPV